MQLLQKFWPSHWFAARFHAKFAPIVYHNIVASDLTDSNDAMTNDSDAKTAIADGTGDNIDDSMTARGGRTEIFTKLLGFDNVQLCRDFANFRH